MTKAAKAFGKDVYEFLRLPSTVEYTEALTGIFPDKEIVIRKRGSGLHPQVGTWGHPKLAVFFARWLDVKFAVFCDMVIDDILNKKAELTITKPEESAAMALPKTQETINNSYKTMHPI
ncbi:hypothetical protein MFKK_06750 [Halopseudomonas aestusnigri]|uniref:KilA-N domain-containing protein n=1 Tax=Halopseudomonas TaxID=2901189 RepID=UPI0022B71130|nr:MULTISPECIES: KilA-N domain-containing protein [Halopseudomonas]BDX17865.1 hypothetical protein MFKK_06750 [Halopseudomonas aestusnigri]